MDISLNPAARFPGENHPYNAAIRVCQRHVTAEICLPVQLQFLVNIRLPAFQDLGNHLICRLGSHHAFAGFTVHQCRHSAGITVKQCDIDAGRSRKPFKIRQFLRNIDFPLIHSLSIQTVIPFSQRIKGIIHAAHNIFQTLDGLILHTGPDDLCRKKCAQHGKQN